MRNDYQRPLFLALIIVLLFSSCTFHKKMIYLQGAGKIDTTYIYKNQSSVYKIHPGDVLFVKIQSLNKDITTFFNVEPLQVTSYNIEMYLFYNGYPVSEDGYIEVPSIGKILANDLTVEELQKIIQTKVNEMLKDAQVIVKFGGFKFTVLGEVNKSGVYYYYNNKLSILEAISQAGNLTDYGNRENILILRPTKDGTATIRVNLLDQKLLENPFYYLNPNDIVYVESVKTKNWKLNASNISIILSSITTMILVINFILRF